MKFWVTVQTLRMNQMKYWMCTPPPQINQVSLTQNSNNETESSISSNNNNAREEEIQLTNQQTRNAHPIIANLRNQASSSSQFWMQWDVMFAQMHMALH